METIIVKMTEGTTIVIPYDVWNLAGETIINDIKLASKILDKYDEEHEKE